MPVEELATNSDLSIKDKWIDASAAGASVSEKMKLGMWFGNGDAGNAPVLRDPNIRKRAQRLHG
jgi:hypothetical protein